jgi:arylsulfatase
MAVYAAQIDRMDQNIGRILGKLKETCVEDNTLVLFLADNGGCSVEVDRGRKGEPAGGPESFLSYGLPWANASNTPFRMYKSWSHEGGISTPLIAHWPARIKQAGKLTNQPGHIMDIMATCLELAGAKYPRTYKGREIMPLEGRSLVPVLDGKRREPHPQLCWEHQGNRALRQGNLKLVSRKPEKWELYDVADDRTELKNLAEKYPAKVKEMDAAYQLWAKRCGVLAPDELRKNRKKG